MKRRYVVRIEEPFVAEELGKNLGRIFPGFYSKAREFFGTVEGMKEFVEWLRSLPEGDSCKEELPMWEAKLKEMEVAR